MDFDLPIDQPDFLLVAFCLLYNGSRDRLERDRGGLWSKVLEFVEKLTRKEKILRKCKAQFLGFFDDFGAFQRLT